MKRSTKSLCPYCSTQLKFEAGFTRVFYIEPAAGDYPACKVTAPVDDGQFFCPRCNTPCTN